MPLTETFQRGKKKSAEKEQRYLSTSVFILQLGWLECIFTLIALRSIHTGLIAQYVHVIHQLAPYIKALGPEN